MSTKPNFNRAQNEATKLLLSQKISSLFIDVRKFSFDRKIIIDSVQHYAHVLHRPISNFVCDEFSGCCVIPHPRCNLVLYDDRETNECRKHWGIVHEVGHVYLEHSVDDEKEEKEANFFAAQIVTPEIVLYGIRDRKGTLSKEDLLTYFNISHVAAVKRISTLNKRPCYNNSSIDKMLLSKFTPVLDRELCSSECRRKNSGTSLEWNAVIGNSGQSFITSINK